MAYFLLLCISISHLSEVKDYFFKSDQKLDSYRSVAASHQANNASENDIEPEDHDQFKLVPFDPNLASEGMLISMGIPDYLAKRIVKYRQAGGTFKEKIDLNKIYGLNDSLFNVLQPFIQVKRAASIKPGHKSKALGKKERIRVDINHADSSEFISLSGIGPVYASRIIRYREVLGGFVCISQLREVYGIDDSLYHELSGYIKCDSNSIQQMVKINTASKRELYRHPYLRSRALCQSIVRYRDNHGPFRFLEDLTNLHLMNDSILSNIGPYLSFQIN
ncbi:MAG: helix-hairpin-helix domain-containing protein [Vicingaceae bacterium]